MRDCGRAFGHPGTKEETRGQDMRIRLGECNRCGKCCDPTTIIKRLAIYASLGIPVKLNEMFPCPHFSYVAGMGFCAIYKQRPQICRDFPLQPADTMRLPECSYRFIWGGSVLPPGSGLMRNRRS